MGDHFTQRQMLERLIAFPTVSRHSNLDLIDFVSDYLSSHGIESRRVPNEDGTKANLYAQIGPDEPGGVILSGHSDVVPIDGQDWTSDPFSVVERDGKLFGRGTCDMKGFVATALALVPQMQQANLKRPIQLAISYDEEIGCLGVDSMVREMRETLPPASAVIVGEPTMMQVVTSHKGMLGMFTRVRGYEVHSSQIHRGVSAVMYAARLIGWLTDRLEDNKRASAHLAPDDPALRFEPPYTTLHAGVIKGGTAHNITARNCTFSTDIRVLPTEQIATWRDRYLAFAAELDAEMKAIHPAAGIDVDVRVQNVGCRKEPDVEAHAEMLARALTGDNVDRAVPYGTEAGNFQREGYSVCVCGPGDIAQAHQPDEYISLDQLAAGEDFVRKLIHRLSA